MNKDQVKGRAAEAGGKVRAGYGDAKNELEKNS